MKNNVYRVCKTYTMTVYATITAPDIETAENIFDNEISINSYIDGTIGAECYHDRVDDLECVDDGEFDWNFANVDETETGIDDEFDDEYSETDDDTENN